MIPRDIISDGVQAPIDNSRLDDRGSRENEERLKEEGRGQGGAAEWREKTRKAAEEEAAKTEADDGEEGFDPAVGLRGVMGGGTAKAKEDCVALYDFCEELWSD